MVEVRCKNCERREAGGRAARSSHTLFDLCVRCRRTVLCGVVDQRRSLDSNAYSRCILILFRRGGISICIVERFRSLTYNGKKSESPGLHQISYAIT